MKIALLTPFDKVVDDRAVDGLIVLEPTNDNSYLSPAYFKRSYFTPTLIIADSCAFFKRSYCTPTLTHSSHMFAVIV